MYNIFYYSIWELFKIRSFLASTISSNPKMIQACRVSGELFWKLGTTLNTLLGGWDTTTPNRLVRFRNQSIVTCVHSNIIRWRRQSAPRVFMRQNLNIIRILNLLIGYNTILKISLLRIWWYIKKVCPSWCLILFSLSVFLSLYY